MADDEKTKEKTSTEEEPQEESTEESEWAKEPEEKESTEEAPEESEPSEETEYQSEEADEEGASETEELEEESEPEETSEDAPEDETPEAEVQEEPEELEEASEEPEDEESDSETEPQEVVEESVEEETEQAKEVEPTEESEEETKEPRDVLEQEVFGDEPEKTEIKPPEEAAPQNIGEAEAQVNEKLATSEKLVDAANKELPKDEQEKEEPEEEQPDTHIYALRTTANREDQVLAFVSSNAARKKLPVYSVIAPHGMRGYIFLEAADPASAEQAASGVPYAKGILPSEIQYKEIEHMLEQVKKEINIQKNDIVEIISGPFKREKAKISRVDKSKEEVVVELLEAAVPIPITLNLDAVKVIRRDDD